MEIINGPSNLMELTLGEMGKTRVAKKACIFSQSLLFAVPLAYRKANNTRKMSNPQASSEGEEPALTCSQKRFKK